MAETSPTVRRTRLLTRVVLVAVAAIVVFAVWLMNRSEPGGPAGEPQDEVRQPRPARAERPPAAPIGARRGFADTAVSTAGSARLRGRAVDGTSGEPLPGASARAVPTAADGRPRRRSGAGDEPGEFAIAPIDPGAYSVTVRAPQHLPRTVDAAVVVAGRETDLGDVELPAGGFVSGTVVQATDQTAVAGAVVRQESGPEAADSMASAPRSVTDDRGVFVLGPLEPGACPIRVSKPGYQVLRLPEVQAPPGGTTALGVLPLQPRAAGGVPDEIGPAGPGLAMAPTRDGYVVRVVAPGSPAAEAGIPEGARVLSIAGHPAVDLSPDQIIALLQGEPGTRVSIGLASPEWPEPRTMSVMRK